MQGTVIALTVAVGDSVSSGDPVAVIEAMKMENSVPAPRDGIVETVLVAVGDAVGSGDTLITLQSDNSDNTDGAADA